MIDNKYYLSDKMKQYISRGGTKNFYMKPTINERIARPLTVAHNKRAGTTNYICKEVGESFMLDNENVKNLRIRKLTPKECWRLMGFDDEDFEKAEKVNSNAQLYKQAGNSIVVNCLEALLKNLFLIVPQKNIKTNVIPKRRLF
jgi:DNA (cytosine-5)-methyltransferase 1